MKKIFLSILITIIFFSNTPIVRGQTDIQKGMSLVSWEQEGYNSYTNGTLKILAATGANYISIIVTQYQRECNSTSIFPTDKTPGDSSIKNLISRAHSNGFKVMIKPHIDLIGKTTTAECRGDIGFFTDTKWEEWFSEYQDFILHYALLAQETGAEIFCVGTELSFTTQKDFLWKDMIIKEVKKIYSGKLIYAANWDNYRHIKFWNELDYIGIDAYFPLTYRRNPSAWEILRGWEKWKAEIRNWHKKVNKPIIFTEIGYPPTDYAAASPWDYNICGNFNIRLQTRCYEAFFKTIWGCSWLKGTYWWYWRPGSLDEKISYNIYKKPAENFIEKHYQNN